MMNRVRGSDVEGQAKSNGGRVGVGRAGAERRGEGRGGKAGKRRVEWEWTASHKAMRRNRAKQISPCPTQ